MAYGPYYNATNKVVYDGDTAAAADLNAVNSATESALSQVANDLDDLELAQQNWEALAEKWATDAQGVNPDPLQPTDFSAYANAKEAEGHASEDEDVLVTGADGASTGTYSAKHHALKGAASSAAAAVSETNALASENKAADWAEEAEDVEVDPGEYSAKHHALKAAASASSALGANEILDGTDTTVTVTPHDGHNDYQVNVDDVFVRNAGDTMTGDLVMSGSDVVLDSNYLRLGLAGGYPALEGIGSDLTMSLSASRYCLINSSAINSYADITQYYRHRDSSNINFSIATATNGNTTIDARGAMTLEDSGGSIALSELHTVTSNGNADGEHRHAYLRSTDNLHYLQLYDNGTAAQMNFIPSSGHESKMLFGYSGGTSNFGLIKYNGPSGVMQIRHGNGGAVIDMWASDMWLAGGALGRVYINGSDFAPLSDGTQDCGKSNPAWKGVYTYSIYRNNEYSLSDERHKEKIKDLSLEDAEMLYELVPVEYEWKKKEENDDRLHYGFIAQAVDSKKKEKNKDKINLASKHLKEGGDPLNDEDYDYRMSYTELIAPMLKLIQSQKQTIDDLQARVATLEGK